MIQTLHKIDKYLMIFCNKIPWYWKSAIVVVVGVISRLMMEVII